MKRFVILLFAIFFSGCIGIAGYNANRVEKGMSYKQVELIMGKPDVIEQEDRVTVYKYLDRFFSGWSWDVTDFSFVFEDGKLVSWSKGEIKKGEPRALPFIVPPHFP